MTDAPNPLLARAAALPIDVPTRLAEEATQRRWASEAGFFDALGAQLEVGLRPVSHAELARYLEHPRALYDKEFRFSVLGNLDGMRVLDVGCGRAHFVLAE